MLSFSRTQLYAVEAMLALAYRAGESPLPGKQLCEQLNLPPRYLEPVLQQLVRARLLRSLRGPSGGYLLALPADRITLFTICHALADPNEGPPECASSAGREVLPGVCQSLTEMLAAFLSGQTLAALAQQAARAQLRRAGLLATDYAI